MLHGEPGEFQPAACPGALAVAGKHAAVLPQCIFIAAGAAIIVSLDKHFGDIRGIKSAVSAFVLLRGFLLVSPLLRRRANALVLAVFLYFRRGHRRCQSWPGSAGVGQAWRLARSAGSGT